jgi:hypothetical protein
MEFIFLDSWTLKMVSVDCPEISIRNNNYSLRKPQESANILIIYVLYLKSINSPHLTEFSTWMKVASPLVPTVYLKWRQEKKTDSWARLCLKIAATGHCCVLFQRHGHVIAAFCKWMYHEHCFEAKYEQKVVRRNMVGKILSFLVTLFVQFVDKNIYSPSQTDSIHCHGCKEWAHEACAAYQSSQLTRDNSSTSESLQITVTSLVRLLPDVSVIRTHFPFFKMIL